MKATGKAAIDANAHVNAQATVTASSQEAETSQRQKDAKFSAGVVHAAQRIKKAKTKTNWKLAPFFRPSFKHLGSGDQNSSYELGYN